MAVETRGRIAPSLALPISKRTGDTFVGAYPWNAPRAAIGRDRPLTRAEFRQVQGVLYRIDRLPFFLKTLFTSRYNFIRRTKSPLGALYFLKNTFERKLLPRLERVNELCGMNESASIGFLSEHDEYARLPDMNDKELKNLRPELPRSSGVNTRNSATNGLRHSAVKRPFSPMRRRCTYMVRWLVLHARST